MRRTVWHGARMKTIQRLAATTVLFATLVSSPHVQAHCDSLDGPVIVDARAALEDGTPESVLKWVRAEDETTIRTAFAEARAVRSLSPAAMALADRWFFETLVRVHREGEGAPYTGLKPAGHAEPGIEAADEALHRGDLQPLIEQATQRVAAGLASRFQRVRDLAAHKDHSVAAGRAYVAAYVDFIHFAEAMIEAQPHGSAATPDAHAH